MATVSVNPHSPIVEEIKNESAGAVRLDQNDADELYIRNARKINNPGETLTRVKFLEEYFPELKAKVQASEKPTKAEVIRYMKGYLQYMNAVATNTHLDKVGKFSYQLKAQSDAIAIALDAGQFERAKGMLDTMSQMIQGKRQEENIELVIDGHQWKHYKGGQSGASQFTLEWKEVHQLLLCAMSSCVTKNPSNIPNYLLLTVTGAKSIGDGGKAENGPTAKVKIEIGKLTKKKELEFHGYPIGAKQYALAKGKNYPELEIAASQYATVKLAAPNDKARTK
jgi:hypothetical protein